jgi:hypothetical protein
VVLSLLALVPDVRFGIHDLRHSWATLVLFCLFALIFAFLMWKRMVRFRELSETTVFRVYLAIFNESNRPS